MSLSGCGLNRPMRERASVDDRGLVELKGSGEASITAMYLSKVAVATLVVPFPQQISRDRFRQTPRTNFIDDLVLTKLETLNIEPSEQCTDSEFIRRAYLDTTGTLPSVERGEGILVSADRDKRQRLVQRLLASESLRRLLGLQVVRFAAAFRQQSDCRQQEAQSRGGSLLLQLDSRVGSGEQALGQDGARAAYLHGQQPRQWCPEFLSDSQRSQSGSPRIPPWPSWGCA